MGRPVSDVTARLRPGLAAEKEIVVGEGTHERIVVDLARFDGRVRRKLPDSPR